MCPPVKGGNIIQVRQTGTAFGGHMLDSKQVAEDNCWHWQFCADGRDISCEINAHADEIRLVTEDAEFLLVFQLLADVWTLVSSDVLDVTQFDPTAYRDPLDFNLDYLVPQESRTGEL